MSTPKRKLSPRLAELLSQYEQGRLTDAGAKEIEQLTGMAPRGAWLFFDGVGDVVEAEDDKPPISGQAKA